jgi:hypothetical protein
LDYGFASGFTKYHVYELRRIDLRSDLETAFNNLHKSCIRRKIRRAEREGLKYEAGRPKPDRVLPTACDDAAPSGAAPAARDMV